MKQRFTHRSFLRAAAALVLTAASSVTLAHDSWFVRLGGLSGAEPLLALGTGNQFPVHEFSIDPKFLAREGCRWSDGQTRPMRAVQVASTALVLRPGQPGATACWAQLQPFDVEVELDKVDLYLAEINATPALRATWAAMRLRGVPWRERYTKHARIELQAGPGHPGAADPADMAVDIRRVSGPEPGNTQAGETLVFELRRNGRPLVGMQLELRHATSSAGVWHVTDSQGRVIVQPAAAGEWLLRGVDLRLSTGRPDWWESDFITLAFAVLPRP